MPEARAVRAAWAVRRTWAVAAASAVLLAGCTAPQPEPPVPGPEPTPTASAAPPLVVATTERPATFDPAAATTGADAIVALNAFSRLMVVHPDGAELKPDLATDCLYSSPTTYRCELPEGLTFHNGHDLTASDVKFSIERAYRMGVSGGSIGLFDSLQRVDVVDELTVEFALRYADTQFGHALATAGAGIVDEELYDPDAARPDEGLPVGSGPFRLVTTAEDRLVFERFEDYRGALTGGVDTIEVRLLADSAAAEEAMANGDVHAVWRSLNEAARERLEVDEERTAEPTTDPVWTPVELENARVQRLVLSAESPWREDTGVRAAIAAALQPDRTLASLVPPTVPGSADTFAVGGSPEVVVPQGQRPRLTLAYDSAAPDQRDIADLLRDRLEERAGLSVQLVPDAAADLVLTDRPAWVNTAVGWLQAYVEAPLPGSAGKVRTLMQDARSTTDAETRDALLAEVQAQAAADLTVLPVSAGPTHLYLADGVRLEGQPFGPGWHLGLWSFRR